MKNLKFTLVLMSIIFFLIGSINAQTDRSWWNSLSPAWKKVIQKQQFKGKDINPTDEQLEEIAKMIFLDISGDKSIKTLKPAAQLQMLEVIKCNGSSIKSLEGVEGLINLRELDCSDNDFINSLKPLMSLNNITKINCGNTMVKSLMPLRYMTKLTYLDLHFTTIVDLRILKELKGLEYLDVSNNISLYSLEGVNYMFELREINCSKTNVDNLGPLTKLPHLAIVDCSDTKVFSLRPLQLVKTLNDLDCSNTFIKAKSLDYLLGHSALTMLRCKNIDITKEDILFFEKMIIKKNSNVTTIITGKSN